MFERIVVLLDGSEVAEGAISPALEIARGVGAKVILLHGIPTGPRLVTDAGYGLIWPDKSLAQLEQDGRRYLEAIRIRFEEPDLELYVNKAQVDWSRTIKQAIAMLHPDLLVVAPKIQSRLGVWLNGNIVTGLLRAASCPLLIVGSRQAFRKVLVAVCLTHRSDAALTAAAQIGSRLAVEQVTVCDLGEEHTGLAMEGPSRPFGARGWAAAQLLLRANLSRPDLVVIFAEERAGTRAWPFGTAAEEVFRTVHCSLLSIPYSHAGSDN
jgi:nucleotide-binding universal stress UspA family protein